MWRCVRNGYELDNHVIRGKRKECERIEKDRKGRGGVRKQRERWRLIERLELFLKC